MPKYINADALVKKAYDEAEAMEEPLKSNFGMSVDWIVDKMPAADVIHLDEVYRLIAGHSNYHGDGILSALTCVAEGKEVRPVKPADVRENVHGEWVLKPHISYLPRDVEWSNETGTEIVEHWHCSKCDYEASRDIKPKYNFCPNCGAKMGGGTDAEIHKRRCPCEKSIR